MTKKARILIVTRGLPFHTLGGMEVVAWDLARGFARSGMAVTVLTTSAPSLQEFNEIEGVNVHCVPAPQGRYSPAWWRLSRQVYLEKYADNTDIVLSVSAAAMSMARNRSSNEPLFIIQAHGTAWGEFISKIRQKNPLSWLKSVRNLISLVEDRGYRQFDSFVAVGPAVAHDLKSWPTRAVIGNTPIRVIANGIDAGAFAFDAVARDQLRSQLKIAGSTKLVLSASRLHPQKGVVEGLRGFAVALQQTPGLHLLILGEGPDKARIAAEAERLGISDKVTLAGYIARSEITAYLSAADIFLFTTKRVEGLPMNILEALANGLPAILSTQIASDDLPASAVDPDKPDEIAVAILNAMDNRAQASILPSQFTLEHSSQKYLDYFKELQKPLSLSGPR